MTYDPALKVLHLIERPPHESNLLDERQTFLYRGTLSDFPKKFQQIDPAHLIEGPSNLLGTPIGAPVNNSVIEVDLKGRSLRDILTYAVPTRLWESRRLWTTMTGPSPKKGQRIVWLVSYTGAFKAGQGAAEP